MKNNKKMIELSSNQMVSINGGNGEPIEVVEIIPIFLKPVFPPKKG